MKQVPKQDHGTQEENQIIDPEMKINHYIDVRDHVQADNSLDLLRNKSELIQDQTKAALL